MKYILIPLLLSAPYVSGDELDNNSPTNTIQQNVQEIQELVTKVNIPTPLNVSKIGQAILKGSIHAYTFELTLALNQPAFDFFRAIKAREGEKTIWTEMTNVKTSMFQQSERNEDFFKEAVSLLIAVTPPLGKTNAEGLSATELALELDNQPLYKAFKQHKRIPSRFELDTTDKQDLWGQNIALITLEEHPLAKAIIQQNKQQIYQELKQVFLGPAKDFLSLIHSRTSEHKTIFHLLAEAKTYPEEMASVTHALINFSAPNKINFIKTSKELGQSYTQNLMAMATGWMSLLVGFPLSAHYIIEHQYSMGIVSALLTLKGLSICEKAFRANKVTDPIIKNRLNLL